MNSTVVQSISERLPTHSYYFVILFRCYYKKGYTSTCPNSEGCLVSFLSRFKFSHFLTDFLDSAFEHCFANTFHRQNFFQIPQRSDMKCVHSDANYKSGPQMEPITYHYHENPRWSKDIGCYT